MCPVHTIHLWDLGQQRHGLVEELLSTATMGIFGPCHGFLLLLWYNFPPVLGVISRLQQLSELTPMTSSPAHAGTGGFSGGSPVGGQGGDVLVSAACLAMPGHYAGQSELCQGLSETHRHSGQLAS